MELITIVFYILSVVGSTGTFIYCMTKIKFQKCKCFFNKRHSQTTLSLEIERFELQTNLKYATDHQRKISSMFSEEEINEMRNSLSKNTIRIV